MKTKMKLKKKILIGILTIVVLAVLGVAILGYLSQTPISKEDALNHFETYFEKESKPSETFSGIQVRVFSKSKGIDWEFASGTSQRVGTLDPKVPFHVASVGKLFTATVVYQLAEEGKIELDSLISAYLPEGRLENLFVFKGTDYSDQVTWRNLLAHTSGAADYFDGPVLEGETMSVLLKMDKEYVWTPEELLDFSKERQVAVGAPNESYSYSDTGYILLGFLIEAVEGKSFEAVLEDRFFKPLQMKDTYMAMRSEPLSGSVQPLADLWLEGEEIGATNALSVDWSGGGVVSTLEDLLLFSQALHSGRLISQTSLEEFFSAQHQFNQGIYTGAGGMEVFFKEFFPLLSVPNVRGHIGILGTHVFYDASTESHIILNYGSTDKIEQSFRGLIEIMIALGRIE